MASAASIVSRRQQNAGGTTHACQRTMTRIITTILLGSLFAFQCHSRDCGEYPYQMKPVPYHALWNESAGTRGETVRELKPLASIGTDATCTRADGDRQYALVRHDENYLRTWLAEFDARAADNYWRFRWVRLSRQAHDYWLENRRYGAASEVDTYSRLREKSLQGTYPERACATRLTLYRLDYKHNEVQPQATVIVLGTDFGEWRERRGLDERYRSSAPEFNSSGLDSFPFGIDFEFADLHCH